MIDLRTLGFALNGGLESILLRPKRRAATEAMVDIAGRGLEGDCAADTPQKVRCPMRMTDETGHEMEPEKGHFYLLQGLPLPEN